MKDTMITIFDIFEDDWLDLLKMAGFLGVGIAPTVYNVFFEKFGLDINHGFEGVLGQFLVWLYYKKYKSKEGTKSSLADLLRDFILAFFIAMFFTEIVKGIFPTTFDVTNIDSNSLLYTTLIAIACGAFYEKIIKRIVKKADSFDEDERGNMPFQSLDDGSPKPPTPPIKPPVE